MHSPSPSRLAVPGLVFLCLPFLLPVSASAAPSPAKVPSVELYSSRSEEAPSVRLGLLPFPDAREKPRWSLGVGTFWSRYSLVNPYLGTGLAVGLAQPQPQLQDRLPGVEAAPWVGGGVKLNVADGASIDLGLRSVGQSGSETQADRRGGREAGIQLNLKW